MKLGTVMEKEEMNLSEGRIKVNVNFKVKNYEF
jgi:hypothetical protein